MSKNKKPPVYTNTAQQRALKLIFLIAGNELHGVSQKDLAVSMQTSMTMIFRDLKNLEEAGMIEQVLSTNHWRLTPKIVQVSNSVGLHYEKMRRKLDEMNDRYTRISH